MEDGVGESVESEKSCLKVAMEVDGGVIGQERGTEVHIPSDFLLL